MCELWLDAASAVCQRIAREGLLSQLAAGIVRLRSSVPASALGDHHMLLCKVVYT